MKQNKLKKATRILLVLCSLALAAVLLVPLWKIDLVAPQYPEGLRLLIYPNGLKGNVDIINGLNHYIGMKTLHTADFIEFTVLPYIIVFFSIIILIPAILNRRYLLHTVLILFICFGVFAMWDFWKWEYNYGHNLNPDAAIIVPGMAYQPPLIGYKQLLNFSAYSLPDIGGWLFIGVGAILLLLVITEWVANKKRKRLAKPIISIAAVLIIVSISSCNTGPEAIVPGKDQCSFCKMTISDNRFGAEVITKKGKIYKFDDTHCLLSFLEKEGPDRNEVKQIYFTDFSGNHTLLKANSVFLLKSEKLKSPMAGNIAAFGNKDSLDKIRSMYDGDVIKWNDLYTP